MLETLDRQKVWYLAHIHLTECAMQDNSTLFKATPSHGCSGSAEQLLPTQKIQYAAPRSFFGAEQGELNAPAGSGGAVADQASEGATGVTAVWPEAATQGSHVTGNVSPRRQRRFACKLLMNVWEEELAGLCETIDISAAGMRVRRVGGTRRRLRSNEIVLEFQLPDSNELFRIPAVRERMDDGRTFFARFTGSTDRTRSLTDRLTSALTRLADGTRPGAPRPAPAAHRAAPERTGR